MAAKDDTSSSRRFGRRELIVIARKEADLRASPPSLAAPQRLETSKPAQAASLREVLEKCDASMRPLFGLREDRLQSRLQGQRARMDKAPGAVPRKSVRDLTRFYVVDAPPERLEELAWNLRKEDSIETAYIKPPGDVPSAPFQLNMMRPSSVQPPTVTPDFSGDQAYLGPAPAGVDAQFAWTLPGGVGAGVHITDLEWGWRFTHEDLQHTCGVVAGVNDPDDDHGTAVIGEMTGGHNGFGVKGICPGAGVSTVSFSLPTAQAIRIAADRAKPGDILLLEIHRPGPNARDDDSQFGFIPIEWWPDDFEAIRYAVEKGVIVVEAAGNGFQDLDDPIYNAPGDNFPDDWENPLNPTRPSSGAVLVGAGAPPPGTHGRNWGTDRSRLDFSNFGARVDAQGWGTEVTTTGYGDRQGGWNRDEWYTDQFSGTSSASPIVAGSLACIQGALAAARHPRLGSLEAIALLRATGSPQQDQPANGDDPARPRTQRIGNRPDIRAMKAHLRL